MSVIPNSERVAARIDIFLKKTYSHSYMKINFGLME